MHRKIRWGILATGGIAHKFADDLKLLPEARIIAIGSRNRETAERFGDQYEIPYRFGSYQELVECPEVEVIYIGTPHPFHKENTILALNAGKVVLCEKPFALNAQEAREMIELARAKELFLMEAMWARFTPLFQQLKNWIREGLIGEVRLIQSDYGQVMNFSLENRFFNPDLGGGSLLDIGIYPISLASFIYEKQPNNIQSRVYLGNTDVDELAAMIFDYGDGRMAVLSSAITLQTCGETVIFGTEGTIQIPGPWHQLREVKIIRKGREKRHKYPRIGRGYAHQAIEVMQCLKKGRTESPIMRLDESLAIMQTLDRIRELWGFKYPMELL
jgi:dihydrodiol dehydrogenase / D-xylose 1-dehydrogenase (NADP)